MAPSVAIVLDFESLHPRILFSRDCLDDESTAARFQEWLRAHPELARLYDAAYRLAERQAAKD